jgi:hypothetical protein
VTPAWTKYGVPPRGAVQSQLFDAFPINRRRPSAEFTPFVSAEIGRP